MGDLVSNVIGGPLDGDLIVGPDKKPTMIHYRNHQYVWDFVTSRWHYEGQLSYDPEFVVLVME